MVLPKIQQTKLLFTFQMFGDLFLFGLVWQYSSVRTNYNKGRFKVMATYLQQQYNFEPIFIHCNGYLSRLYFWVLLREQVFCFSHHLPDVLLFGDVLQPKENSKRKDNLFLGRHAVSVAVPYNYQLKIFSVLGHQAPLKVAYSQKVFHFDSNLQKKVPNHCSEHLFFRWIGSAQGSDLESSFFGDWSQSEKRSDIKPPLTV